MTTDRVTLARGDTAYLYFDFAGLPDGATAQAQVGDSEWGTVDFSTGEPRMLVRGPDAANSSSLLVSASGTIRVRLTSVPEMRTISGGYLTLVQPND